MGAVIAVLLFTPSARAAVYSYVDWTSASVATGAAAGLVTRPDSSTVSVTFNAIAADGSSGRLYGAQVNGGVNYWSPTAAYVSVQVENAPPTPDILQLQGGQNETYRVTLSEPIKDPIMALVSLGQAGVPTTYAFDAPFTIVSQGAGYFGGSATALESLPGNVLRGSEGSGTIQFIGTFSSFSWTVPTPESWHGFTFGIRTTERLEPTPDGGAGGASGAGGVAGSRAVACAPPPCGMATGSGSAGKGGSGGATAGGGQGGAEGLAGATGSGGPPQPATGGPESNGCSCAAAALDRGADARGGRTLLLVVAALTLVTARRQRKHKR